MAVQEHFAWTHHGPSAGKIAQVGRWMGSHIVWMWDDDCKDGVKGGGCALSVLHNHKSKSAFSFYFTEDMCVYIYMLLLVK